MSLEEIISTSVQIVEYSGEDRPLKFAYILDSSSTPYGLDQFIIKGLGISLSNNNIKIKSGTKTYSKAPDVVISGGGGMGATAGVVLNTDKTIKAIEITNGGAGYTSAPSISLSGGTVDKDGTDTTIEVLVEKPDTQLDPPKVLDSNLYVWIHGKGAYLTQETNWIFLEDLTNLYTKIDKIYTTTDNGAYLTNSHDKINDKLNQIRSLERGSGYIVVVKTDQTLPFVWYNSTVGIPSQKIERIVFDIEQCYDINKQSVDFIDANAKAIRLDQRVGVCRNDYSATVSVVINLTNLRKNTDYHIHLDSYNKNILFIDQDFYLNNNQLSDHSVYAKVKFINNTVNSIFSIDASLNIGNTNIDRDVLSIYVDCPPPPAPTPTPRPAQPIVRIVE